MGLASLQSPVHIILCGLLVQRVLPYTLTRLPIQLTLVFILYAATALLLLVPFRVFVYQRWFSPLRHIPSAPAELNHWKTWLAVEPSPPQLLEWVKAVKARTPLQGLMRYRGIGGGERVLLCSPASLRDVLVAQQYSHFDRPTMARKRIAIQAGSGLIASGGDTHKAQKKLLLPAFGPRAVKELHPLLWSKAQELVTALRNHIQTTHPSAIEVTSWTSRSALDIIGVAAWGFDLAAISQPDSDFLASYSGMFDISGGGPFINALALVFPMKYAMKIPCPYNRRLKHALRTIRSTCEKAVRNRLLAKQTADNKDILSLLINGGVRDENALVNQMMTILAAGHDTSSLTLAWASYVLSRHQEVQTRLRNEIMTSDVPFRTDDNAQKTEGLSFQGLPYLQAVANEILRLYPAVPITRREALQDATVSGYFIPKGSHLVSSGWVSNRMAEQWGMNAEDFNPVRWTRADDLDNFAFASFSHGPRSCIGQGFARAEFLTFLCALVGNFRMETNLNKKVDTLYGITMSPAGGIEIYITPIP